MNEYIGRLLGYVAVGLLSSAAAWFIIGFIFLDWNITHWSDLTRSIMISVGTLAIGARVGYKS